MTARHFSTDSFSFIQSADLLVCLGTDPTSRLIQWWTNSRYSHVGLAIWINDPVRRLAISDAIPGIGVRLVPIESFVDWPGLFEHFETRGLDRKKMVESAFSRWVFGYPTHYQFIRSFSYPGRAFFGWLKKPEDVNPLRVHCSEHLGYCCLDGGGTLPKSPQRMSPGDIVELEHNNRRIFESSGRFSLQAS